MRATIVEFGLTIAGDVSSFGEMEQERLANRLIDRLDCHAPKCILSLRIGSASISVDAVMTIPSTSSIAEDTVARVRGTADDLLQQDKTQISTDLDVVVESVARQVSVVKREVIIVVAPPPPPPAADRDKGPYIVAITFLAIGVLLALGWVVNQSMLNQRARTGPIDGASLLNAKSGRRSPDSIASTYAGTQLVAVDNKDTFNQV